MSGSINIRIKKAIAVANKIAANPESSYLRQLKEQEGTSAVYDVVLKRCMQTQRIPEHIAEQILSDGVA